MTAVSTPACSSVMAQLWRLCGIPHKRHSRAMHLYDAGVPLPYIRDLLGHAELATTPHKGNEGRPLGSQSPRVGGRLVELSHVIRAGMVTYPGLPGSQITPDLIREACREHYAPGTGFWLT
jgi:hypothetical protein